MASTTNYNWTTPDNSGLVKNGAQDIRTLGSAVDTSLWNVGFGQAGKNKIINGDFGVWQRGTSFTPASGATVFSADRWANYRDGSGATVTVSQQSFTSGTAPTAGYEGQFFYRYAQTVAGSGGTAASLSTRLENGRLFAGQTVTISYWAKADAARTINVYIEQNFGSGGSSSVFQNAPSVTLTTSWVRYTSTFSIASVSGKTFGNSSYFGIGFALPFNTTQTIDIWGVQAEYGSVATPFQTASGSIQGELALCQRYYVRSKAASGYAQLGFGTFGAANGTTIYFQCLTPVTLRGSISSVDWGGNLCVADGVNVHTGISSIVQSGGNGGNYGNFATVAVTMSSSVLTTFRPYSFGDAGAGTAYLGFSAEL